MGFLLVPMKIMKMSNEQIVMIYYLYRILHCSFPGLNHLKWRDCVCKVYRSEKSPNMADGRAFPFFFFVFSIQRLRPESSKCLNGCESAKYVVTRLNYLVVNLCWCRFGFCGRAPFMFAKAVFDTWSVVVVQQRNTVSHAHCTKFVDVEQKQQYFMFRKWKNRNNHRWRWCGCRLARHDAEWSKSLRNIKLRNHKMLIFSPPRRLWNKQQNRKVFFLRACGKHGIIE